MICPGADGLKVKIKVHSSPKDECGNAENMGIYPNPATETITVNDQGNTGGTRFSIRNVLGQEVLDGFITSDKQDINISKLISGNYVISVYKDGMPVMNKLFVKE